jgi:intracellular septation protein
MNDASDGRVSKAGTTQRPPSPWRLFFGGLLPIVVFTVIEERYGAQKGLIAGLIFGAGEVLYEKVKLKKVSKITWVGNGFLVALGAVSLLTADGFWFKMQPAIMEFIMVLMLWGSLVIKKPLFKTIAEMQGTQLPSAVSDRLFGITFRSGLFFLIHTGLAIWAAYSWTTTQWALLKGLGLTISFVIYLVAEGFYLRLSRQQ